MAKSIKPISKKVPLVSVVMSVYNCEKYVVESIESILSQTFTNFEFIIINDGSTDDTLKIIKKYKDPRIVLISRANRGLVASLNEGIGLAQGKYIARMDGDDMSDSRRIEHQVRFLQQNPGYVLVGTSALFIDGRNAIKYRSPMLTSDSSLRMEMFVRSPFVHPSVMYAKSAVNKAGMYKSEYWPAEDYDLWRRMADVGKIANLGEYLFSYRDISSGSSISNTAGAAQCQQSNKVRTELFAMNHVRPITIESYSEAVKAYSGTTHASGLQRSRLRSTYILCARNAWKEGEHRFALQVASKLLASKQGIVSGLRYARRKFRLKK